MKQVLTTLLFLQICALGLLLSQNTAYTVYGAKAPQTKAKVVKIEVYKLTNREYIEQEATKYGVNPALAVCLASHESRFNTKEIGDDGNSRGIFQISSIYHPEVSDSCAFSLECSTKWSLNWIKKGHVSQWSTYRLYCSHERILYSPKDKKQTVQEAVY